MTRLTFGVAASPFLATMVLLQQADDYQDQHPAAAELVKTTFYVDHCLTGADTEEVAIQIRMQLNALLERGCMKLRKWRSNSKTLLATIP